MSYAIEIHRPDMGFFGRLAAARDAMRVHAKRARVYHDTLLELSRLSDRELADIGLAPGDIEGVAWSAAKEI